MIIDLRLSNFLHACNKFAVPMTFVSQVSMGVSYDSLTSGDQQGAISVAFNKHSSTKL